MKEIRCKGCGEWIPLSRLVVVEGGIVARRRKFICPICLATVYEETPSFQDWLDEELTAGKDYVRINHDPFARFPRWGTAEIGPDDLDHVEVMCPGCKAWVPWRNLESSVSTSPTVGWVRVFRCPQCGKQLGSSHGADPAYGVPSRHFQDEVVEAVREGRGWARLAR
jgi:hypothetical protein